MLSIYSSKRRADEGFTLIELLVVVIIIGILAAIALPIFIDQQKVATDASVKSDVRNTVTNVTNMQAQNDASSFKLAASKNNTVEVRVDDAVVASVKGSSTSAADVTLAAPIKLGVAYTVDGYNAGGKQYQGPSVTGGKVFKFTSATGQFTTDELAGSAADGSGGTSTGGSASLPHGYKATPANASYNGGEAGGSNLMDSGDGIYLVGSAFGTDGTSPISGAQPVLNGMKPYPDPSGIHQSGASNVVFKTSSGQVVSGFSGCTSTAYYVPKEYGPYFGGYSGDADNFLSISLGCATSPASVTTNGGLLSNGKVTFDTAEGSNTFNIGTVKFNGPGTDTPTNLSVGAVASRTETSTATGYDGTERTVVLAVLTKNDNTFTDARFATGSGGDYQYAADGSQRSTSSIPLFNNVDVKPTFPLSAYLTNTKVYDKDGNDVTASYRANVTGSLKPNAQIQSATNGSYYIFRALVSISFENKLTSAQIQALNGGKITFDGGEVKLANLTEG